MHHKLKEGYAHLLDVPVQALDRPGFELFETPIRDDPEWAHWILPIWFFSIESKLICSVSPHYRQQASYIAAALHDTTLLAPETLETARATVPEGVEWVQCEILFYPHPQPPDPETPYRPERLRPSGTGAGQLLRHFDGGVYVVRNDAGHVVSHAAIKDKGLLQELAVGTEAPYRRRGMGKAVVVAAVADILARGKVPVYWPDSLANAGSYALAHSLGFEKVAEMLFCCFERAAWEGFPLAPSTG